ncbi:MAG: response regulator [Nevskiaceae bacterium]|nr:MAG: response regulator [Nevskiaceae bacterium]
MKPTLVLVDDEERILRSLAMLFRPHYSLFTTVDAREALDYVRNHPTHVIVSDQRMPAMRGADLLKAVKDISPNTMRLLLTGYSELEAIVASVNEGEVFRFINKPWDAAELKQTVNHAAEIALNLFSAEPAVRPPVATLTETGSFVAPQPGEGILVIDDDAEVYKAVQEIVGPAQPVHWASSLEQAFALLAEREIGVVISELFVRREAIALALKLLKAQHPEVVTIVMTPFQDTTVLIGLINQGQVYRFLPKPIRRGPLGMNIASALRHHRALKSAPRLREAHAVETLRQPEDSVMATRVMGFLGRLRNRNFASSRA